MVSRSYQFYFNIQYVRQRVLQYCDHEAWKTYERALSSTKYTTKASNKKKKFFQDKVTWRKNMRPTIDNAFGIDLSRNFGHKWNRCNPHNGSFYSLHYNGPEEFSEKETQFIRDVLKKFKVRTRAYLSIRRNGHALLYPYASSSVKIPNEKQVAKLAYEITTRVNQKAGVLQIFTNDSISGLNGFHRCGHSVDYAYELGIPYCYEYRVFLGEETDTMAMFQAVPKAYFQTLLAGYLAGLKRLYELLY